MKRLTAFAIFLLFISGSRMSFSQGSWNPPGADASFPRSLLDSLSVPEIRATLNQPEIIELYHSVWNTANSVIPAGNSSDGDRFARAVIAREAAFVALMDRKWENGSISVLSAAEKDSMAARSVKLLSEVNTSVGYQSGWVFYQEWQHRSKELIMYLTAYDLLRGAGINSLTARDSLISFTGNLYYRAMATYTIVIFHLKFFDFQFDNHSIMTASALGMAAVVLNDHQDSDINRQPLNWINAGLWNLDNTLFVEQGPYPRVSQPDTLAGYAEGPGYFDYAFQNAFPFIRSLYNFLPDDSVQVTFNSQPRRIRNPWYDPRYDRIYDWMLRLRMPDGSMPAIHDSPIGFGTMITALSGKPEFNIPYAGSSYDSPFVRTQYISTNVAPGSRNDSLFEVLPAAGSLIFRSSGEPGSIYMHFIAKHGIALTGAKSHHQGDASSFSLMAYGKLLAVDPGYPGAPESDFVNKAKNHNCILVNQSGPQPPNGEFVQVSSNTAFIEDCFSLPAFDYGEVRTSYWGDSIIRCNIFPRRRYFIMNDLCSADTVKGYTFQFQGNGLLGADPVSASGTFIPDYQNNKAVYKRDSVSLLVMVQSDRSGMSLGSETDSLATGYSTYRKYSKLLANPDSAEALSFQTLMFPFTGAQPQAIPVMRGGGFNAGVVYENYHRDFMLTQTDTIMRLVPHEYTGLVGDITCNAQLGYLSQDTSGQVVAALIRGGSVLSTGGKVLVRTLHPMLLAWNLTAPGRYTGYSGDSGTAAIQSPFFLRASQGSISSVSYDSLSQLNYIHFTGKGKFMLEPSNGMAGSGPERDLIATACPNPSANGLYMIRLNSGKNSSAVIKIINTSGQTLLTREILIKDGQAVFSLDLSLVPAGIYLLSVDVGEVHDSLKIIRL